jgi:hypothetical protein
MAVAVLPGNGFWGGVAGRLVLLAVDIDRRHRR